MVEPFHPPLRQRIFNRVLRSLTRLGIPVGPFSIVVVRGRKTGKPYAFPVTLVTQDGKRWLVSAYGEVSWVWNVRAAGEVLVNPALQSHTRYTHEPTALYNARAGDIPTPQVRRMG